MIDEWKTSNGIRKTIPKNSINKLGLENIDIKQYVSDVSEKTGKISEKQYKITNWFGLIKEICKQIPDDEYPLKDRIKFQQEVLGYIEYTNPKIDKRIVVVTNLNIDWSPKFEAYCLNNGQICSIKIHKKKNYKNKSIKTSYKDLPVENGDIIYLASCKKEPKRRKNANGDWENIQGEMDWWVNDYRVVNL